VLLLALPRRISGQSATGDIIGHELPLTAESATTIRSGVKLTTSADVLVKPNEVVSFNNTLGGNYQTPVYVLFEPESDPHKYESRVVVDQSIFLCRAVYSNSSTFIEVLLQRSVWSADYQKSYNA